jgi:hypothetical protein
MKMHSQALGIGLGQSPTETSLPWYQQFWDELVNPIGTDTAVLAQQTAPVAANLGTAATNLSGVGLIVGVGALALVLVFAMAKR